MYCIVHLIVIDILIASKVCIVTIVSMRFRHRETSTRIKYIIKCKVYTQEDVSVNF